MSPDEMIELVMAGKKTNLSQELYVAFWQGYPIENLRQLLISDTPEIKSLGSYLVYELGAKCRCLLDEITLLLQNENPQIRSDAIFALLDCCTKFDVVALGEIILLLDDPDPFVQRGAMRFIQMCERPCLNAGVKKAAELKPCTVFEEFPNYLRNGQGITSKSIRHLISHENPIAKRFGVGLAVRPRLIVDESFLDIAENYDNEECLGLIEFTRKYPAPRGAVCMKL